MRAPTLAAHALAVAEHTDALVVAVRGGDPEAIHRAVSVLGRLRPPHGCDPVMALAVSLAAQIDPAVPVDERLAWVHAHDPARLEVAS